jgi:hypothetical protein
MRSLTVIFIFVMFSCKKQSEPSCFKVKYIDGFCYTNVFQIITPDFQHLGQTNWIRQIDNKQFKHVFVLQNHCEDISNTYNTTDSTYTVRLLKEGEHVNTTCFTCQAVYNNPPTKSLPLKSGTCEN